MDAIITADFTVKEGLSDHGNSLRNVARSSVSDFRRNFGPLLKIIYQLSCHS